MEPSLSRSIALALLVAACTASGVNDAHVGGAGATSTSIGGSSAVADAGPAVTIDVDAANSGGTSGGGTAGVLGTEPSGSDGPQEPFPATPLLDENVPDGVPALFAAAEIGGPPCVVEPEGETMIPNNWLRPRFRVLPVDGQNVFEIRLHVDGQTNDLVAYTTRPAWPLPKPHWAYLAHSNAADVVRVDVSIRAATYSGGALLKGPTAAAKSVLWVAPAPARGTIVYWTVVTDETSQRVTALRGFRPGEESVGTVLLPEQVQLQEFGGSQVNCIGCHIATPDGQFASFATGTSFGIGIASVKAGDVGAVPDWLGSGAMTILQGRGFKNGLHAYSKAHFAAGDRIVVTALSDKLGWIDLEAQGTEQGGAYDYFARSGDGMPASGAPTWSNDGSTIVYTAVTQLQDGRLGSGAADLYSIPYADRKGGSATPIAGAADASVEEYYPNFSPDDVLLAFTSAPSGTYKYDAPKAEIEVIPAAGGTPTRLVANDPPACVATVMTSVASQSPGIANSYPRWAPQAVVVGDKTYRWVAFASRRGADLDPEREDSGKRFSLPQIVIAGVVTQGDSIQTYGGVYVWNQPPSESNHTPAWDVFDIPQSPPPPPPPPPPVIK